MSYETEFTLWFAVTFVIVISILILFVRKPIIKGLDKRAEKIRSDLNYAEQVKLQNEILMKEQERILEETRAKAQAFMDEEKKQAEEISSSIINSAKQHAEEIVQLAHKEVILLKERAIEDIKSYISEKSCDFAGDIIQHSLNTEDNKKIVLESLSKIGKSVK